MYVHTTSVHSASIGLPKSKFERGSRVLSAPCPALIHLLLYLFLPPCLVARPPDPGTLSLVCVSWCEYNNSPYECE